MNKTHDSIDYLDFVQICHLLIIKNTFFLQILTSNLYRIVFTKKQELYAIVRVRVSNIDKYVRSNLFYNLFFQARVQTRTI